MSDSKKPDTTQEISDATTARPTNRGRRRFLAQGGMYTAGLVGAGLLGACNDTASIAQSNNNNNNNNAFIGGPPDEAILNFALNLGYLEAEYYVQALTGTGLQAKDRGDNAGDVIVPGTTKVDFSSNPLIGQYAAEIAADELHHVQFLRSALGKHAVDSPKLNLMNSFAFLGGLIGAPDFNPFADPTSFLLGAFIFEDVGVTAYHGAAPFVKNRTYLDAAAGILSVEAYHAALIRTFMATEDYNNENTAFTDLTNLISGVRDSVDGTKDVAADYANGQPPIAADDDQGLGASGSALRMVDIYGSNYPSSNVVPTTTDGSGRAYNRSVATVLNVVYATAEQKSSGGFYPNGVNLPAPFNMSADNS